MVSLTCCTYVLGEGGGGAMIFSFDKSTALEGGGSERNPWDDQEGGFKKMKGKNKEIIIAHPLDKLWMLPYLSIYIENE